MIAMWEIKGGGAHRPLTTLRSVGSFSSTPRADCSRPCAPLRGAGVRVHDVYAPYPVHGLDDAMGIRRTRLPFVTLLAGLLGLCFALTFQYYTAVFDWPLDVGGKPENSTLAFVPVCFELTVLIGGLGTVGAFLLRARLYPGKRERLPVLGVTNNVFAWSCTRTRTATTRSGARAMQPSAAPTRSTNGRRQSMRADALAPSSAALAARAGWRCASCGCGARAATSARSNTCPTWRAGRPTRRSRPTPRRATG